MKEGGPKKKRHFASRSHSNTLDITYYLLHPLLASLSHQEKGEKKTMAHASIFRVGSAFNAVLLACIILKHVSLAVARSALRHVCMAFLLPLMLLHVAIIDG
ncbi:hypothetical protein LZ30DRAFT_715658 [Colletotrichum cereale]|nr:hypothetical protein LZ30DRAFT_715658 [Colletotrichum cereale]